MVRDIPKIDEISRPFSKALRASLSLSARAQRRDATSSSRSNCSYRLAVDRRGPVAGIVTRALAVTGIADGNGIAASVAGEKGHVQRHASLH